MRDVTPEYERIANPLGGNGEEVPDKPIGTVEGWNGGIVSGPGGVGASRREPAGETEAVTGSNQPQDQKVAPEPPGEAGNGKKRQTSKRGPEVIQPSQDVWNAKFQTPWNRQNSNDYVTYALIWIENAPSRQFALDRWNTERAIRNGLANPLDKEQMAACQEALGRIGS